MNMAAVGDYTGAIATGTMGAGQIAGGNAGTTIQNSGA